MECDDTVLPLISLGKHSKMMEATVVVTMVTYPTLQKTILCWKACERIALYLKVPCMCKGPSSRPGFEVKAPLER